MMGQRLILSFMHIPKAMRSSTLLLSLSHPPTGNPSIVRPTHFALNLSIRLQSAKAVNVRAG